MGKISEERGLKSPREAASNKRAHDFSPTASSPPKSRGLKVTSNRRFTFHYGADKEKKVRHETQKETHFSFMVDNASGNAKAIMQVSAETQNAP